MEKYSNIMSLIESLEEEFKKEKRISEENWNKIVRKNKKDNGDTPSKQYILQYIKENNIKIEKKILKQIQMKPTRTISGVTPITIFTKPYKCSGNCIFCPTSKNTPKSYLPEEPGIQRALYFNYEPYKQIQGRIKALNLIGHNTNKIELIISGGTWDDYDINYKIWYILEVYRALNKQTSINFSPKKNYNTKEYFSELKKAQEKNKIAEFKNVGLSIETRPDKITKENIKMYRIFGVTKIQIGIQSLNEKILKKNNRQHTVKDIYNSINLLRLAGFKIHIHWMCNLFGSNHKKDYSDFKKIFTNKNIKPDEIKIYPCSIIKGTQLFKEFKKGNYKPYTNKNLVSLLIKCKKKVPIYCRINRLIRDIPSNLIVEGNKITNLRQNIQEEMRKRKMKCNCIRCREIKKEINKKLKLKTMKYKTSISTEYFLEYVTEEDKIAGFLRLSIYKKNNSLLINTKAMIRELHVYGMSLNIKDRSDFSGQHLGLGTKLLIEAEKIVKKNKLKNISVISATGTREYYEKRGFKLEKKYGYLIKNLND